MMLQIGFNRDVLLAQIFIVFCLSIHSIQSISPPHCAREIGTKAEQNLTKTQEHQLNSRLKAVLSNEYHTIDDGSVDLNLSKYAWLKMEENYKEAMRDRVSKIKPFIKGILARSRITYECYAAIRTLMNDLGELKLWASRMWNAWGKFPVPGFFAGSYTDLGSYKSCMKIPDSTAIGQAQYCTLEFQPLVPSRPRYHSITKRVLNVDQNTGRLESGDINIASHRRNSQFSSHGYGSRRFQSKSSSTYQQQEASILGADYNLKTNTIIAELAEMSHFFYYVKLRIGSCWPSQCKEREIQSITQQVGAQAILQPSTVKCFTRKESRLRNMNMFQIFAAITLSFVAMLSIIASFIDMTNELLRFIRLNEQTDSFSYLDQYLEIFSLTRNCKRLFSTETSQSLTAITTTLTDGRRQQPLGRELTCLRGMKVLSMIWVIYGHSLLNTDYQSFTHASSILDNQLTNFFILPSLNPNFSVDTFFLISGLLSAYVVLHLDVKFNACLYTLARYIRLTPQLVVVILLFFLLPLTGEGPLHKQNTDVHAERCFKNFWVNLLYLQSYINRKELCIIPSWWLSIEMTFHLISIAVLYLLIKKPKLGLYLNYLVILIMTAIGTYIHYSNGMAIGYLPSIPQKYEVEHEQTQWFFHRPYPHAASYFIGIGLGFILVKKPIYRMSKLQIYSGWFVSACCQIIPLCGIYYWNLGYPYSQLESTAYYNICQILWPISIAWIILACSSGYGGQLDAALSSKFFVPLARITYMTFLSHILIIYYFNASLQHTLEPSAVNLLMICISNIFLSLIFGAILSLIYEAPILNMQRIMLRRKYIEHDTKSNKLYNHNKNLTIES